MFSLCITCLALSLRYSKVCETYLVKHGLIASTSALRLWASQDSTTGSHPSSVSET